MSPDRAKVVSLDEIEAEDWTLNISRYVLPPVGRGYPAASRSHCRVQAGDRRRAGRPRIGCERSSPKEAGSREQGRRTSEPAGARVVSVGGGEAPSRADRRGRLQAVRLPAALLQASLGRVGRGVSDRLRARPQTTLTRVRPRTIGLRFPKALIGPTCAAPRGTSDARLLKAFRAIEAANPKRLAGIFGNASWTDKAQMPDATLKNLIEHFSQHDLGLTAVPEDELGNAYEYLIKQFADDSGHTAQEFYTNRTLVHLMAQMLEPQAGRAHLRSDCRHGRHADLVPRRGEAPRRRRAHARSLRPGADPHHGRHRPNEPRAPRRRGLRHRRRQHAEPTRPSPSAIASARSTWCSPTRRIRSRSGTARRGRTTRGAATSSGRRRRAAPTTRSSSTS